MKMALLFYWMVMLSYDIEFATNLEFACAEWRWRWISSCCSSSGLVVSLIPSLVSKCRGWYVTTIAFLNHSISATEIARWGWGACLLGRKRLLNTFFENTAIKSNQLNLSVVLLVYIVSFAQPEIRNFCHLCSQYFIFKNDIKVTWRGTSLQR